MLRFCVSIFLLTIFSLAILSHNAEAKLFQNSYVSFELPPNWECKLDGTEWVCVSKFSKDAKEAIIILTAKEVGPTDTFGAYVTHLKTPRNLPDKTGKMQPSQALHVTKRLINSHEWVDSLHLGSEITSYYSRYLATIKHSLAILVTFSAHKESYTKYSSDFLKAIETLRVIASKDILAGSGSGSQPLGSGESMGIPVGEIDSGLTGGLPPEPNVNDMKTKLLALALLLVVIGIYLWRKKKN
ncbi:MAG: hypothetical protein A2Z20_06675 [Bdellovibrionales bacterium RBG_16_40_8]|nr:MAG: hypothetical protein A2Z20_06675 [Bdellovibrionales bacterium RBG_16_40_8]